MLQPTLGWVPFQGAEEEALGHLPWWPVNSIPGEENLYWLQEAQPGCLARADAPPPFLLPSNLPWDASLNQAFWQMELKTAYQWVVSEKTSDRHLSLVPSLAYV